MDTGNLRDHEELQHNDPYARPMKDILHGPGDPSEPAPPSWDGEVKDSREGDVVTLSAPELFSVSGIRGSRGGFQCEVGFYYKDSSGQFQPMVDRNRAAVKGYWLGEEFFRPKWAFCMSNGYLRSLDGFKIWLPSTRWVDTGEMRPEPDGGETLYKVYREEAIEEVKISISFGKGSLGPYTSNGFKSPFTFTEVYEMNRQSAFAL